MKMISKIGVLLSTLGVMVPVAARADNYNTANFTLGVFGGNANQQSPFQGVVASYPAGGTFTGSLVFDQDLVPANGTGYVNVFFSSFPDIDQIPGATALSFQLGSLPAFTLSDAVSQQAAIQYNNGVFNGLFYISDFTYLGNPYELQIQGGSLAIVPIVGGFPSFNSLVNGYVQGPLTNIQGYVPPPPIIGGVPEPATWALTIVGFSLIGSAARRRQRQAVRAHIA